MIKDNIENIIKSIFGGISIGLACIVFILINNKIIGSFCFSIGLFLILTRDYNLFTGKLCFLERTSITELLFTWIGNAIGIILLVIFIKMTRLIELQYKVVEIISIKENDNFLSLLILSICCQFCINISVSKFKEKNLNILIKLLSLFIGVFVFVICGFEHCIANMFYVFFNLNKFNLINLRIIFISTTGNIIGGIILYYIKRFMEKNNELQTY